MKDILKEIVSSKVKEVQESKKRLSINTIKKRVKKLPKGRDFKKALLSDSISLIAEVKKHSPSVGTISRNFKPVKIAKIYENGGAKAISVLTDKKYFKGDLLYLRKIKNTVKVPVLRKDFIIDEYQIYESKYYGADAILLIVSILSESKLKRFIRLADSLNITSLVEVHNKNDIKKAVRCKAKIIGINNRDLKTFKVTLKTTASLMKFIPKGIIVVSESGIKTKKDINYLRSLKVNAILMGETLMRSSNKERKIRELFKK